MSKLDTATAHAALAANAATPVPSAPPFTAPWGRFRNPPQDPPGYWSAIRHDVWNGSFVMQLGTLPHPATSPQTNGSLFVGYQWMGYLPAGRHNFTVRVHLGPVSQRPNGGQVQAFLLAQLFGPQGQLADFIDLPASRFDSYWSLRVTAPTVLKAGNYTFRFGGGIVSSFQRDQTPYGEIICKDSSAVYDCSTAVQGLAKDTALPATFADERSFLVQQVSEQEAARSRMAGLVLEA